MMITLGGIGLFLLGMLMLTDGIKALAGTALRAVLTRFIRGPVTGMLTGTGLTAVLQSSSATMLMTIGFVSAGLISFPQALGVIFGANLGTTSTGWIVSILGFKLSVGAGALPLIFGGALMRLLARGRVASIGTAVAGFGMLFLGIGMMQEGMGGLSSRIDLAGFAGEGLIGVLMLVGVGLVMTVVMQSSSAAMAITLAALHTGGIDITQGAALVIGQNVGTTVTAALAAIGASNAAKRTAVAHIAFNSLTGLIALGLLPLFAWGVGRWEASSGETAGVGVLAGYHTAFNVVGVAVFLPFVGRFAALIERIVPERRSEFVRHLDPSVAGLGEVGIETARRTLSRILEVVVGRGLHAVRGQGVGSVERARFDDAVAALSPAAEFVALVGRVTEKMESSERHIELVHAIDHLERLGRAIERVDARRGLLGDEVCGGLRDRVESVLMAAGTALEGESWGVDPEVVEAEVRAIGAERKALRDEILRRVALGRVSAERGSDLIESIRALDAAAYHLWRALLYLAPGATVVTVVTRAEGFDDRL